MAGTGTVHMMVDIETLSTHNNAHILCASLVPFFPEGDSHLFRENVENYTPWTYGLHPNAQPGRHIDPRTVSWWFGQSSVAQARVNHLWQGGSSETFDSAHAFCNSMAGKIVLAQPELIWAKSPTFDLAILRDLFYSCGVEVPWKFYEERDVRTAQEASPGHKALDTLEEGEAHDPLYDCKVQAYTVQKFYRSIRSAE